MFDLKILQILLICFGLSGCAEANVTQDKLYAFNSVCSWYGKESGKRTASGAKFNPLGFTVAHRTLPFGTKLKLTNKDNGKSVFATVTDRGPFVKSRLLDVSEGVADALGFKKRGIANLFVEVQ